MTGQTTFGSGGRIAKQSPAPQSSSQARQLAVAIALGILLAAGIAVVSQVPGASELVPLLPKPSGQTASVF